MGKGIDMKGVCKLLANAKNAKGYTNARLAELSGVSKFTVGSYLKGVRVPSLQNLQKLCPVLDLDADKVTREYGYYPEPRKKKVVVEKPVVEEVKEEETTMPVVAAVEETKVPEVKEVEKEKPSAINDLSFRGKRTGVDDAHRAMFGKWLDALMNDNGVNRDEYAELTGIDKYSISKFRSGSRMPCLNSLVKICKLHGVDWKVAACYFAYADFKAPAYWLGDDYKSREDWQAIDSIVKAASDGTTNRNAQRAIKRQSIKKPEAPAVDISEYTNRIAELESQLEEARKETSGALADLHDMKEKYEGRWEVKLANIRKELEDQYNESLEELKTSNAKLQADLVKTPVTTEADMYVAAVENQLRNLLPKAKEVVVSCTPGKLYWHVELPGLESEFSGELTTEDFAQSIHKSVTEAALATIGLN